MKLNLNISGYEGPLDLLLELSKKQKVDIKKISILELANQYLDFIDKNLNQIKLSADYLVTASLLAFLKSKLLLPEDQNDDSENIEEDLTNRLNYKTSVLLHSPKKKCYDYSPISLAKYTEQKIYNYTYNPIYCNFNTITRWSREGKNSIAGQLYQYNFRN